MEQFEVHHKASNKRNALDVDKRTDGKKKQIPHERIVAVRMSWIRTNLFPITQWIENLTTDEKARLLMEIEIGRQMRARQQVNLVLPKFSGDGGYTKGEVDFETWKYMAETYIDDNYSEGLIKSTIRKSLVGEAA